MKFLQHALIILIFISAQNLFSRPDTDDEFFRGPFGPEFHGERKMKMNMEKVDKLLKRLEQDFPQFHQKLAPLRETHPHIYDRNLRKLRMFARNHGKTEESRERIIGIFGKEIEFDLLAEKYRSENDPDKKNGIRSELKKMMTENFDIKEDLKLEVIRSIEKRLEEKRIEYQNRQDNREEIIETELDNILRIRD